MGYCKEPTCEINVGYMNIIKVNYSQISSLGDISIFSEYGINIFNNDGTFKNGFEIIRDMEVRSLYHMQWKRCDSCAISSTQPAQKL